MVCGVVTFTLHSTGVAGGEHFPVLSIATAGQALSLCPLQFPRLPFLLSTFASSFTLTLCRAKPRRPRRNTLRNDHNPPRIRSPSRPPPDRKHHASNMGALDFLGNNSSSGGVFGALIRLVLRFFQFVLAITVAGLYGVDLHHAKEAGAYTDGKWAFAEVVAGLAAVTVLIYAIPFFKSYWAFGWDWVLL